MHEPALTDVILSEGRRATAVEGPAVGFRNATIRAAMGAHVPSSHRGPQR
jgi:hypothetical protein